VVKIENGDAISGDVTIGNQLRFAKLNTDKMHAARINFYGAR